MPLKTTWKEIQVASLQKMFLISGREIERNDSTNTYLASMPVAYNEAVRLLSQTNRYIVKSHDIVSDGLASTLKVNIKEEIPDLFMMKPDGLYFTDYDGAVHECFGEHRMIGNDYLVLDGSRTGTYTLYYYAYPLKVTAETKDETDLQIDPDVASLIPLYIASQLYKEDDPSMAATWRNEFEMGREELKLHLRGGSSGEFRSTTEWW